MSLVCVKNKISVVLIRRRNKNKEKKNKSVSILKSDDMFSILSVDLQ